MRRQCLRENSALARKEIEKDEEEHIMFFPKDNTYNDIRDKSLNQWLDEMEQHEDVAVRGGVKLTREYMQYLKSEIKRLEEENELKNQYLKKMSRFQPQKK